MEVIFHIFKIMKTVLGSTGLVLQMLKSMFCLFPAGQAAGENKVNCQLELSLAILTLLTLMVKIESQNNILNQNSSIF